MSEQILKASDPAKTITLRNDEATGTLQIVRGESPEVVVSTVSASGVSGSTVSYTPSGTGAVATTVQSKLRETVSVKDFGAVGDGVTDDTAAFTNALASGQCLHIPAGTYLITSSLPPIATNGTYISGDGKLTTHIIFRPTISDSVLFDFTAGTEILYYCGLSDIRITNVRNFDPSDYTVNRKIAVRVQDVSEFDMRDVEIAFWTDSTFTSEGMIIKGREFINLTNVSIHADKPIVIDTNQNHPYIACDSCTWTGIYLRSMYHGSTYSSHPCIQVINQGHVMHWTVNGCVMSGEGGGFYYTPNSPGAIAYGWNIHGMHYEQPTTNVTSAYGIKVAQTGSPQNILGVTIEGFTAGSWDYHNGIYLRHVQGAKIANSFYGGTAEALFVDSTDGVINLDCYLISESTAVVTTSGMYPSGVMRKGAYTNYHTVQYVNTAQDYKEFHIYQGSRDMASGSGSQSLTGFGFKPRMVMAFANVPGQAYGFSTGGAVYNVGEVTTGIDSSGIGIAPLALMNIQIGANSYNASVGSLDTDGVTINWTRTGTPTSTLVYTLLAWR